MQKTIEVNCPPERLWMWLEETDRIKQWMPGLISDVPTSEGPTRVGSTSKFTMIEGRQEVTYDLTITTWEPHRRMGLEMIGGCMGPMTIRADYELEDLGGRTRLKYSCGWDKPENPSLFMRFMMLLGPIFAKLHVNKMFSNLKRLAEADGGEAAAA